MAPDQRRRDPDTRAAILQAVRDIAVADGWSGLSVEGVARRAGAGKQTVYRWWPSLSAVVIDAVLDVTGTSATFPDTGDLAADLRTQMRALARQMNAPLTVLYTGLIGAAQREPDLAAEVHRRVIGPRFDECRDRIAKAQADGEIRADVDPADVVEQVYAPLYYRLLLQHRKVTLAQVDRILDLVFAGLRPTRR